MNKNQGSKAFKGKNCRLILIILLICLFMVYLHFYSNKESRHKESSEPRKSYYKGSSELGESRHKESSELKKSKHRESSEPKYQNIFTAHLFLNQISKLNEKVENITEFILSLTQRRTIINDWNNDVIKDKEVKSTVMNNFEKKQSSHKTNLISTHKCNTPVKLLILVTTHASNFDRRETVRKTWGTDKSNSSKWKTYFLIGRSKNLNVTAKTQNESEIYKDLIFGDVFEDFYNLTYKVQMGFEWAIKYCNFQYLLKGDDDVFINTGRVFDFLHSPNVPRNGLYAGNVHYAAGVFRTGRYGVKSSEFSKDIYPRYCSGGGFILSYDVVYKMLATFNQVESLKIDDAYLGVVALKIGVDVIHHDEFRMFEDWEQVNRCVFTKTNIIYHPVKIATCMEYLYKKSLKI